MKSFRLYLRQDSFAAAFAGRTKIISGTALPNQINYVILQNGINYTRFLMSAAVLLDSVVDKREAEVKQRGAAGAWRNIHEAIIGSRCSFRTSDAVEPQMKQYILAERNGIYIIDLQQTVRMLKNVYHFVRDLARDGGK